MLQEPLFFDWLEGQSGRTDVVGNLARHAVRDKIFPRGARRLYIVLLRYEHLPELRQAAKQAHAEWRRHKRGQGTFHMGAA